MLVETVNSLGECFEVRRAVRGTEPLERRSTGRLWARVAGTLPDDPILHDCLLFYVSDLGSPWNMEAPAHLKVLTSLDHAVWLHHRTRMDEWHYIDLEPGSLADARGSTRAACGATTEPTSRRSRRRTSCVRRPSDLESEWRSFSPGRRNGA